LPPRTSRVSWRHSMLKALEISNLIITSGSEGSELSAADSVRGVRVKSSMEERILAQWESPFWRPAVCKKNSYVDVKIREIGPRTALAARLAQQRRQLSPQRGWRNGDASFRRRWWAGYPHRLWQVSREPIEVRLHILVCGRGENLQKDMVGLDGHG
jgi:hypothetical protein